jgi:hypothetical protein
MKQDIKAQTDDMKSEIRAESSEFVRATYGEKPRGRSSKEKMYSFKNSENPVQKNTRVTKPPYIESQQKCLRCGYDVSHDTCPAIGKQCNSCGKLNHFSSCCRTRLNDSHRLKKYQKAITKDDTSDSDEDIDIQGAQLKLNVRKVNSGKDASNILLPVNVCGVELDIDPDTGADVDLISKDDFQKIYQQHPDVEKLISVPKEAIRALGGAKLGIICILKGAKLSNKTVKNLVRDIYVTENGIHNHPLLSEKTLLELGMVQYSADGEFELIEQMPKESFEEEIAALLFEPDSESDRIILKRANEDKDYQILRNVVENDLWKSHTNNPIISKFCGVAPDLSDVKGLVFYKDLLVPPFVTQSAFIDKAHKIGHSGEKRTVDLLRERIWFPGTTKLAKDAIKSCLSCQMTFDRTYDEPLRPTPLPPDVWHTISIDLKAL